MWHKAVFGCREFGDKMSTKNSDTVIDVAKVCELAHFDLSQEEMDKFQGQLNTILGYVQKLHELNIDGIEPTLYGQPVENVFREDVNEASLDHETVMANAPERTGGEFKVPKIVE